MKEFFEFQTTLQKDYAFDAQYEDYITRRDTPGSSFNGPINALKWFAYELMRDSAYPVEQHDRDHVYRNGIVLVALIEGYAPCEVGEFIEYTIAREDKWREGWCLMLSEKDKQALRALKPNW